MSGALAEVPLAARGIDPWEGYKNYYGAIAAQYAPAQAAATVGNTQAEAELRRAQAPEATARAGYIGQQTVGAAIQNQIGATRLGMYANRPQQQTSSSYPDEEGGGAGQGGGGGNGLIGGSTVPPATGFPLRPLSQPPASPAIGGGGHVAAAPSGGSGGPAIGMYPTTAEAVPGNAVQGGAGIGGAGGGAAPSRPAQINTGPQGVYDPGIGAGALPWSFWSGIVQTQIAGGDVQGQIAKAMADKRAAIGLAVVGTVDPQTGRPDPQRWNQMVRRMYDEGYITNQEEQRWYNHPDAVGQMQSQAYTPTEQPAYKGTAAGVEETARQQAKAGFDIVKVPMPGPNNTVVETSFIRSPDGTTLKRLTLDNAPSAAGPGGSNVEGGGNVMPGERYAELSRGSEGGSGPGPRPNRSGPGGTPTSTAAGGQQFVEGTWLDQMRLMYPDWAKDKSNAQILSYRGNNRVADQLALDYANFNAPSLAAAGMPVDASTLKLAHAFGAGGATKIYNAPPDTPMQRIFPPGPDGKPNPVIAANPSYANQTNSQIWQGITQQFGRQPVAGVNGVTLPAQGAAGGGVGASKPELGPAGENRLKNNNDALKEDTADLDKIQGFAQAANVGMPVLYDIKRLTPQAMTGAYADTRLAIGNTLRTFSPEWAQKFLAATTGLDPKRVDATQELVKQTFKNVTGAESTLGAGQGGVRVGAMLTQFFAKAMPNINMQGPAIQEMTNWLLVGSQMAKDYAQGAQQFYKQSRDAFQADAVKNNYEPLSTYHHDWMESGGPGAPIVYQAAALATNHKPFNVWSKGLNKTQIEQVGGIIARADPAGGGLLNSKNQWISAAAFAPGGQ